MDKPIPEAVVKAAQTAYVAACAAGQKPCPRCGGTRRERDNYTECSVCEGAGWKWDESAPSPMQAALTAAQQQGQGQAVAWNVLRIGNYGAAYDPLGACRAFTYDHQPGNVDAGRLGNAAQSAATASAGDSIDRGLALLKALQEAGFGVFRIGAAQPMQQGGGEVDEVRLDLVPWLYIIRSEFLPDDDNLGRESDRKMREALDWAIASLPVHRTAPPSAPVGVEGLAESLRHAAGRWTRESDYLAKGFADDYGAGQRHAFLSCANEMLAIIEHALAQQPAAVDETARLTERQAIIVTGYTGVLCCKFDAFHADLERRAGRRVWTHEMGNHEWIKPMYRDDFLALAAQPGGSDHDR